MKVEKVVRMYEDKVGSDIQQRTLCMLNCSISFSHVRPFSFAPFGACKTSSLCQMGKVVECGTSLRRVHIYKHYRLVVQGT